MITVSCCSLGLHYGVSLLGDTFEDWFWLFVICYVGLVVSCVFDVGEGGGVSCFGFV